MIPTAFVAIDRLALNASGKVDRHALPEPAGMPEAIAPVEPRDELERQLVEIWRDILSVGQLGIRDQFLRLRRPLAVGGAIVCPTRGTSSVLFFRSRRCSKHPPSKASRGDSVEAPPGPSLAGRDPAAGAARPCSWSRASAEASSAITRSRGCSDRTQPFYGLQSRGLDGTRGHGPGSKT